MKGPKIVVVGAGSYFFGRPAIWKMVTSDILNSGTLALVDTNPAVLKTMTEIAKKAAAFKKVPVKILSSTDRKEVMKGADFVVLTFSRDNTRFRGIDTQIAKKHGVTMCSSDTIGPGGIFRALREIPEVLNVAKDMEKLAPESWLINFINPTSVLGIALMRHAKISSFALCDGNHEPYARLHYLKEAGILPEDAKEVPPEVERQLDLAVGGVNHCTWLVRLNYKGKDYLPAFREKLAARAREEKPHHKAKPRLNFNYALELMDLYGVFPTAVSHTKEYVPFYQGYGVAKAKPEPIIAFDAENRAEEMAEDWKTNEAYASGKTAIDGFFEKGHADHAADIIESMWGSLRKPFYINSANRGAVTNMPDDAFLELRCDVDIHGPRPQPFGLMPRGVLGLQQQVLDTHELTVEAAVSHDKRILLRALATDPIINNLSDAKNIMSDLLDAEKDVLPAAWYK